MRTEFRQLLEIDYDEMYISQIQDSAHAKIIRVAFAESNLTSREEALEEKLFKTVHPSGYKTFANPFLVGLGNPNSDILIVGKEHAYPSDNSMLLMKESINNFRQWKVIGDNDLFQMATEELLSLLGYNPLLPTSYHSGKTSPTHTWSKTCSIVRQVYSQEKLIVDERGDINKSFFNRCFLTELNHRPAKTHEGSGLDAVERQQFLMSPFFRSFPVVIFSAKSYLNGSNAILEKIFDIKQHSGQQIELDRKGSNKDKRVSITRYSSAQQVVYVCDQLSGSSGWTNVSLTNFATAIRNDLTNAGREVERNS
ncbi:MAG TPA: hypothetical protein VG737_16685 [Cyclobacteriaceae bacterium]|nr:hypothetical protein [Cyclobacteriaceae bacterium]